MKKKIHFVILPILITASVAMSGVFRTSPQGTLKDPRDGKSYKTIMIGKKEWLAQNLNYKMEGAYAINNDEALSEKMGRLYTWKAIESKNVCPKGWHVPTNKEWQEIFKVLKLKPYKTDRDDDPPSIFYKETVAIFEKIGFVDKNSFAGTYHDITDEPEFKYTNEIGMFWTSTPSKKRLDMNTAFYLEFHNDFFEGENGVIINGITFRDINAISCRCVKD